MRDLRSHGFGTGAALDRELTRVLMGNLTGGHELRRCKVIGEETVKLLLKSRGDAVAVSRRETVQH